MKLSLNISRNRLCGLLAPAFGLMLALPCPAVSQVVYHTLRAFSFVQSLSADPYGGFVEGTNGALYGVSFEGGQAGDGTLFRLNKDGSGFAILRSFTGTNGDGAYPGPALLLATNGVLYGTTSGGGYSNAGTLFQINQDGSGYSVIKSFAGTNGDGANPAGGLMQASNGALYGSTSSGGSNNLGTIFSINLDGSGYSVLRSFAGRTNDGVNPKASLLEGADGMLYGTTMLGGGHNQGTVFKLNLDGSGYQVLLSFIAANGEPRAGLAQGTDGLLYGTTYGGATAGQGTVFRLSPDGSGYSVLHGFSGSDGANPSGPVIQATNGLLYGTTTSGGIYANGTVFQLHPDGSGFVVMKNYKPGTGDGTYPNGALLQGSDGALYGATEFGGTGGSSFGTVFRVNLDGSGYAVIKSFTNSDGQNPQASLVLATNGCLYGTTQSGGLYGQGVVFKINQDGSGYTLLRSFAGTNGSPTLTDGALPAGGLVQGTDGALYGTTTSDYQWQVVNGGTTYGFAAPGGTVFKLQLDGSGYQVLNRFTGNSPYCALIQATNGMLYGTTLYGGASGEGIIFRLNLDGTGYSVLKSFSASTGYQSMASLYQGSDGTLYGTTGNGGAGSHGTVFKLNLDGSGYKVLKTFFGTDGAGPWAALIEGQDGLLYGTTTGGGLHNAGTVFKLNLDGSGFAILKNFTGAKGDGQSPEGALLQGNNGILYGTTANGGASAFGFGTVFQLNPDGSGYQVLTSFADANGNGAVPRAGLAQGSDGTLYGTTTAGGIFEGGTIYTLVPPAIVMPPISGGTTWHLSFQALSGRTYTVQRAPAPSGPWSGLGTFLTGTNGVGYFEDPHPPSDGAFYRTAAPWPAD